MRKIKANSADPHMYREWPQVAASSTTSICELLSVVLKPYLSSRSLVCAGKTVSPNSPRPRSDNTTLLPTHCRRLLVKPQEADDVASSILLQPPRHLTDNDRLHHVPQDRCNQHEAKFAAVPTEQRRDALHRTVLDSNASGRCRSAGGST